MVEDIPCDISKAWRVDSRFYLVEINERFYLIDYSNPKDFRNYLVPFFPEIISGWDAYDVTQDKEKFVESKIWKIFEGFKQLLFCFFLFFIINSMLFPIEFRLSQWTRNEELTKNWMTVLGCIFLGIFVIIFILVSLTNNVQNLQEYPTLKMQKKTTETVKARGNTVLKGFVFSLITYPILLVIGIGGNNYIQLFFFGFVGTYALLFIKFIEFQPMMNQKIYLRKR